MLFAIIIVIAIVGIIAYGIITKRKQRAAMAALALQQHWTVLPNNAANLAQYLPRYLQGLGQQGSFLAANVNRSTESYDMAYQATVGKHNVVFFQYQYTEYHYSYDPATNQQTEQQDTHTFTILHTDLLAAEPLLLLLHHSLLGKFGEIGLHQGMEQLSLEGDFNQYFDTYMTPGGQIAALSLLTPDIMELIMAVGEKGSLEINGQKFALSLENKSLKPELITPLLQKLQALLEQIDAKPRTSS